MGARREIKKEGGYSVGVVTVAAACNISSVRHVMDLGGCNGRSVTVSALAVAVCDCFRV